MVKPRKATGLVSVLEEIPREYLKTLPSELACALTETSAYARAGAEPTVAVPQGEHALGEEGGQEQ